MTRVARLRAENVLSLVDGDHPVQKYLGGSVSVLCPSCGTGLGTAMYKDWILDGQSWIGGEWWETRLDPPLVSIGLDPKTGLPAYGLRNRARRAGATTTRGRVHGSDPIPESKQAGARRAAILHCPNARCGARLQLDLPETRLPTGPIEPPPGGPSIREARVLSGPDGAPDSDEEPG